MSQTLELDPVFSREWEGKDPFAELEKTEGEIFRQVKNRRTFRFEIEPGQHLSYPDSKGDMVLEKGTFSVIAGGHSADFELK